MNTHTTQQQSVIRRHPYWFIVGAGIIICIAGGASNGYLTLLGAAMVCSPWIYFFRWLIKVQSAALDQAMRPIPDPAQIDAQLRAEGYDPSIADVMALHRYLVQQRNEGLLVTGGILLGSHYLANRARGH